MCNRGDSARLEGKASKTVVRAAMMFGLEIETVSNTGGRAGGSNSQNSDFLIWRYQYQGTGCPRCTGDNARKTKVRWFRFRGERLEDAGVGSARSVV